MTDRVEAAAMASAKDEDASNWHDEPEHYRNGWYTRMAPGIAAADAHDRANGIHRIALDDATVERAAKFLPHDQYCGGIYPCDCWQARMNTARAMLAAAVKEEQA